MKPKTFKIAPGHWTAQHAKVLAAWMKHNGLSCGAAAQACDVDRSTIRRALQLRAWSKVSQASAKIIQTIQQNPTLVCPTCGRAFQSCNP